MDKFLKNIKTFDIRETNDWHLKNNRRLVVKRISKKLFSIHIDDHFRSRFGPVIILKLESGNKILLFPFINLKWTFVFWIASFFIITILDGSWNTWDYSKISGLMQISGAVMLALQLLLMPIFYFIIRQEIRKLE